MKILVAACAFALTAAACSPRDRAEQAGDTSMSSADTLVTTREVEDTTVVRTDTTVRVDTVKKGSGTRDTSKRRRNP